MPCPSTRDKVADLDLTVVAVGAPAAAPPLQVMGLAAAAGEVIRWRLSKWRSSCCGDSGDGGAGGWRRVLRKEEWVGERVGVLILLRSMGEVAVPSRSHGGSSPQSLPRPSPLDPALGVVYSSSGPSPEDERAVVVVAVERRWVSDDEDNAWSSTAPGEARGLLLVVAEAVRVLAVRYT